MPVSRAPGSPAPYDSFDEETVSAALMGVSRAFGRAVGSEKVEVASLFPIPE